MKDFVIHVCGYLLPGCLEEHVRKKMEQTFPEKKGNRYVRKKKETEKKIYKDII